MDEEKINFLSKLIDLIKSTEGFQVGWVDMFNVVALLVGINFLLVSLSKPSDDKMLKFYDIRRILVHTLIGSSCSLFILFLRGDNTSFPFALSIGLFVGFFFGPKVEKVLDKGNKKEKDEEKEKESAEIQPISNNNTISININQGEEPLKNGIKDIPTTPKFDGLDEKNILNLDIIDILYEYDYISRNHQEKVFRDSIFSTPDDMIDKFLEMRVLTEKELQEARAIMNLIRLYRRIVTKEEVLKYLIEIENDKGKGGSQ